MTEATAIEKGESRPLTTFNFVVEIEIDQISDRVCNASFSECTGIEATMQQKTIREGGNNSRQIHLSGPTSYGELTLKRGMSTTLDLWQWFDLVNSSRGRGRRTNASVLMKDAAGKTRLRFKLEGCLPIRLVAPSLNAMSGGIAIEEMTIAYERLTRPEPEGA